MCHKPAPPPHPPAPCSYCSFADRSAAFDFNVSLSDHERQLQRESEIAKLAGVADPAAAAADVLPEAAALYRKHDFSLKEGEVIKWVLGRPGRGGVRACAGSPLQARRRAD